MSGGGAKGFAHIGVLKIIDSLGIKIDYITGTSMGGILGGLYAAGYSGKQLEDITRHINWPRVLSNKIPLNKINIEEKDEYDNYIIEFPIERGRPRLPSALIEGQYMSQVLNTLAYPVRNITDFSKLTIPVQITSSDIINGGLIMQKKGSLPLAIRATLAIPAAFSPVYIDGKLLVDGGMDRNFPVQEAKKMGANFIIGSYTGFRTFTEKEIENPMKLIYQTHAFRSVENSKEQMEMTNILVDFTQPIYNYTTADFMKYDKILKIGTAAAHQQLPALIKLAEQQKKYGVIANHELIKETYTPTVQYNFMTDKDEPLKNSKEIDMLKALLNLDPGKYYPVEKINEGIDRIYGTRFYEKVYYTFANTSKGLEMNVHVKKGKQGSFKMALHYDTDQQAGIIFNYTYRNLLSNRSRLVATIDVAERLKARINYYKFIDKKNHFWIKPSFEYYGLKNNDFLLSVVSTGSNTISNIFNRSSTSTLNFGYSLNKSSFLELGILHQSENIIRKNNIINALFDFKSNKPLYIHNNWAVHLQFFQNSMNAQYYPTKGNKLSIELKYVFNNKLNLNKSSTADTLEKSLYDYLDPNSGWYDAGIPGNIINGYLNEQNVIPVSNRLSLINKAFFGFNYGTLTGMGAFNYNYLNQMFWIGGTEATQQPSSINFIGLNQNEIPANNFAAFSFGLQYNPRRNIYITPTITYGNLSNNLNFFKYYFKEGLLGYGLDIGWMSPIGPFKFTVCKMSTPLQVDVIQSFPWRGYFSFGYKF